MIVEVLDPPDWNETLDGVADSLKFGGLKGASLPNLIVTGEEIPCA